MVSVSAGASSDAHRGWLEYLKLVLPILALTASIGGIWLVLFPFGGEPFVFTDLDYYRAALRTVAAGGALYAALPYPPIAVLAIAPLGWFSDLVGNQVWTAVTLALGVGVAVLVAMRAMAARGLDPRTDWRGLVARSCMVGTLFVFSMPMDSQLANGQLTLLIMALTIVDVAQVLPRRLQGVLVGLAGAIKLTPLIFVPYYLVTGQRRQAAVASASFAAATAVGFALFPSDSVVFWTRLGKSDQFGDPCRVDNLSIHAALCRMSPQLGESTLLWVVLGAAVAAAALAQARRIYRRGVPMQAALTLGAAATVLAPIAWPHYLVWLPIVGLWLVISGNSWSQVLGAGIYFVYSPLYLAAAPGLVAGGGVLAWFVGNLLVLIPVLIGVFGLPATPKRESGAVPSSAAEKWPGN